MSPDKLSTDLPKISTPDPHQLAEQICLILTDKDRSSKEKTTSLLHITVGLVGGVAAVFYRQEENGLRSIGQLLSPQAASLSRDVLAEMANGATASLHEKKSTVFPLAMASQAHIFSCPVFSVEHDVPACLSVLILPENKAPEPFLVVLQLMAAALVQVKNNTVKLPGSLLQLLAASGKKIDSVRSLSDAIRQSSGSTLLAIGCRGKGNKVRLEHVSDVVKVDAKTDQSRRYVKVLQEAANRSKVLVWPAMRNEPSFEESLLLKELTQGSGMRQSAAIPLSAGEELVGVIVLLWPERRACTDAIHELMETSVFLGMFLIVLSGKGQGASRNIAAEKSPIKTKIIATSLFMLLCGIALFPKQFVLHPTTIVKPVQVRYVVARFDGLLQKVFVEPGDRVKKEDQLALLDGRELELELQSVHADSAKSLKTRDSYMASGRVSEAQIALLEYKRLQERESLLLGRQQQLSLQSPFSGIVLSGDLKQSEGGPVAKGEVLFEVAPLDRVLLQMLVADTDISYVKEGAQVDVHFDAFSGAEWNGTVARIAPQSELIQGENVFPVYFEVENRDDMLLPGMQGYASLYCGKKSIIWIYFHKPWYALRRLLTSLV